MNRTRRYPGRDADSSKINNGGEVAAYFTFSLTSKPNHHRYAKAK